MGASETRSPATAKRYARPRRVGQRGSRSSTETTPDKPVIQSVYSGRELLGFLLSRSKTGVEAFDRDGHARLLLGEKINIVEHATAVSTMVRIATRVDVRKIPRDITPSVVDYVEHLDEQEDAAE